MKNLFPIKYLLYFFFFVISIISVCLIFIPNTMIPLLIGLALAYAFDPFIDYFENKGIKREKAVFWFFIAVGFIFLLTITIVLPFLFIQLSELIEKFPNLLITALNFIADKFNIETSSIKNQLLNFLTQHYNSEAFTKLANILRNVFSSTANWIFSFFSALIIPIFFYFFILDIDKMKSNLFKLIPKDYQNYVGIRVKKVDNILSGFIRGQLLVSFIMCFLYSFGFFVIDLQYGLLIGVMSGILNIVPYLGVTFGLIASILMSFFAKNILMKIILILVVFSIVQFIEGFIITPKIVGKKVGLSPLITILSVLIGGELFGISGMLVAIPLFGILKVILRDCKAAYLKSNLYKREKI